MKKLISIIAVFVLALSLFGCTTKSNSQDETEYSKGNYNIAYVTIAFFTEIDKNKETIMKIKELHIPRGQKAAWRGYPNLIDDIDL